MAQVVGTRSIHSSLLCLHLDPYKTESITSNQVVFQPKRWLIKRRRASMLFNVARRTSPIIAKRSKQKTGGRTKVLLETVLVHKLAAIFVASFEISFKEQLSMLDSVNLEVRLSKATKLVDRHLQSIRIAEKITQKVEGQLTKSQKEFLLRQQFSGDGEDRVVVGTLDLNQCIWLLDEITGKKPEGIGANFARAYMSNVCVAEELQRNGLGFALVAKSKIVAEEWGCSCLQRWSSC